jgi:hypothetical protein
LAAGDARRRSVRPSARARIEQGCGITHRDTAMGTMFGVGSEDGFFGFGFGIGGKQRGRFQEGEPGGHDEVFSRDLEAGAAFAFDMGEVLIDERDDRDAGEIDAACAGQIEELFERALPAFEAQDQFVGGYSSGGAGRGDGSGAGGDFGFVNHASARS